MNQRRAFLCAIAIATMIASAGATRLARAADPAPFEWPNGARAAISLAYDDALDSQLNHAVPTLNRHGLKATFYLTLGAATVQKRLPEWRALAAHGHELGNHTLFHQCSGRGADRSWVTAANDLERTAAESLIAQIRLGNAYLHAIDGRTERTFTAPCGDRSASGVDYLPSLRADFVAIKAGPGEVPMRMQDVDASAVAVIAPVDATAAELIDLAKLAARRGTMLNLTFHGIGADYLAVPRAAHDALIAYLAANRDVYWTSTFLDIMKHVQARQRTAPKAQRCGARSRGQAAGPIAGRSGDEGCYINHGLPVSAERATVNL